MYCKLRLMLGCSAAFGWFILRDISFHAVLPMIPLGLLYYVIARRFRGSFWLNAATAAGTALIATTAVGEGVFDGNGYLSLLCLLLAVGVGAIGMSKVELSRISGWWIAAFFASYCLMFIATFPGIRFRTELPLLAEWSDVLVLYLLAFIEPLSLGRDYRGSPFLLGVLLLPFSVVSFLALGDGAFELAEYPYLSVWSGVAVSAFHHLEGIILCLYFGVAALRVAFFFVEIQKIHCNRLEGML
ncbi:MAG: hypothetical protein IJC46_05870 [Clostridia bacterium]|nr:hypothetical protein [Clostridia bacterium]